MSQVCVTGGCKYTSRVLCHCCKRNLCLEHLKQHNETINSELNPLVDEINTLGAQLITLNIEELTNDCREKLDQWRDDCFLMISQFYEKKCQELNARCAERLDLLQVDINQIRSKITNSICAQEMTQDDLEILTLNISDVKQKMGHIKDKCMHIDIHSLKIDENLISIEETKTYELDLPKLSSPYRNLPCTDQSWPVMISTDRFLLVDQYPNITLFNRDLKIVKQASWSNGFIRNMCWASILSSFVIINNEKQVFLVQENSLSIERVQTIEEQYWWACTCSSTSLFLTTTTMGTNIFEFDLVPSFRLTKQWKPPNSCKPHEYIDDIAYNNGKLALIIKVSSNNPVHLEVRSSTTLDRLWLLQLDVKKNWFQQTIRCCPLKYDEWLIVEGNTSHLFHILKNGQMKNIIEYKPSPVNAILFGANILVIRTKKTIRFHRF